MAGALDLSRLLNPAPGKMRKHYTRFVTKAADPKIVLDKLTEVLQKNKGAGFKINEHAARVRYYLSALCSVIRSYSVR